MVPNNLQCPKLLKQSQVVNKKRIQEGISIGWRTEIYEAIQKYHDNSGFANFKSGFLLIPFLVFLRSSCIAGILRICT